MTSLPDQALAFISNKTPSWVLLVDIFSTLRPGIYKLALFPAADPSVSSTPSGLNI
jgi:hypothetical protein